METSKVGSLMNFLGKKTDMGRRNGFEVNIAVEKRYAQGRFKIKIEQGT